MAEGKLPNALDGAQGARPDATSGLHPGPVFISYASQDAEAAVRICDALRGAGIEVWFDHANLRGGDAWDQSIRKQIKSCALFLAVISRITHERAEGYFRLEWKLAVDRSHLMAADRAFLLPVVIDETRDDDARVPERFREVQWTRLPGGVAPTTFVEHVRGLLSEELSKGPLRSASQAARVSAAPIQRHTRASRPRKAIFILTIAVAVAALGYLVVRRRVPPTSVTQSETSAEQAAQTPLPAAFNPPPHSIAVLPFVNMSGDAKQDYFSDGISEELLNALSRLNDLQVVARTSSFSFKGKDVDISTIAHKLNVGTVLEGSIRRSGSTVRITAELINTVSGFHLWSQTYDRKLTDILKIQTEVATLVAQQLEGKLTAQDIEKIELGGTKNHDAYEAQLRANKLFEMPSDEAEVRSALAEYDRAIALDADYAAAYVGRAGVLESLAFVTDDLEIRQQAQRDAIAAARRGVALAPDYGPAHSTLGWIFETGFDFAPAAREYERARALSPGSEAIQSSFALFESELGHSAPALAAAQRAVILDPQFYGSHLVLAQVLYEAGHYVEAQAAVQDADALNPGFHLVNERLVPILLASGQNERARQLCESAATSLDEDARGWWLALAYHALGRQTDAERELDALRARGGDTGAYIYAEIFAQWGDKRAALPWLNKAAELHDPRMLALKVDWMLRPIRDDPQFKAIESRMHFPP